MEARKRFGAATAALATSSGPSLWGFYVLMLLDYWYGVYCEDSGVACRPGEPVGASVQTALAAPGVVAALLLAWRAIQYARTGRWERWRWAAVVLGVSAAGWYALTGALSYHLGAFLH